jgi:hypothetical protein
VDLASLPALAGTSLSERMLNRRMPELDAGGLINRYRIARGRHCDFYYLYGTPAILKQLMLRQIEKAGRDLRAERKRPSENRQAEEDLIPELVELLVRRDRRQFPPATLGAMVGMLRRERLEALARSAKRPPPHAEWTGTIA